MWPTELAGFAEGFAKAKTGRWSWNHGVVSGMGPLPMDRTDLMEVSLGIPEGGRPATFPITGDKGGPGMRKYHERTVRSGDRG